MVDPAYSPLPPAGPSAADIGIATLQRLNARAPQPLVTRARSARLVGERKPVTAVFADIVGSTSLAERIDPEDWTLLINAAFDEMSQRIFDYEGTIAQLQGDAIISFFGAPVAHEDDPERAVRAALAMIGSMATYGEEVRRTHGIEFRIRIGISTGLVLVGNVGSDLRYDYTAIGDTMNLASRLESAAPPGQVYIAEKTARFVRPLFDLEDVGPLELKGKADPVPVFRVIGERSHPGPTRGLEGLTSRMVGRDEELATLLGLLDTVRAGRGRTAFIVAEPGLGKSRLLAELKAEVRRRETDGDGTQAQTAWVAGQASSYGARMPFHLVTDLMLGVMGLSQSNTPVEVGTALRALLAETLPGDDEALDYLALLMGISVDTASNTSVRPTGEFLSERLAATVLRLLKQVARQGPLVIVLEDIHWADSASADLAKALLTLADDEAVLILGACREERDVPGWEIVTSARERSGRALTEIELRPLEPEEASSLVGDLLEVESLPRRIRELILTKAEGNPFFVEEVIRMLVEQGAIEEVDGRWRAGPSAAEATIPDTLHGLILARIDRLPTDARRVLRLASCIDRQFPLPVLEDVARGAGFSQSLGASLSQLEAADLLLLASTEPDLEYRFGHALMQDAAYETVLRQERREWHGLVADALVARYPDRQEELADRLARHFELAGKLDSAVDHLIVAGDRALARNALIDAGGLFAHAQELLDATPADTDAARADVDGAGVDAGAALGEVDAERSDRRRLRVLLGRLASGVELMRGTQPHALLAEGRAIAERLSDEPALSDLLFWEIALRQLSGERPEESEELAAAIRRMESLGDVEGSDVQRAQALARSGIYLWWSGDFEASMDALSRASALFHRTGDAIGAAMAESYWGADLASMGDFDGADQRMAESRRLAETADELSRLDYQLAEAAIASLRGDHGTSMRFAGECLVNAGEIGALGCASVSGIVLGYSQLATGAVKDARQSLERSIELATQGALAPMRLRGSVLLAAVDGIDGDMPRANEGFHSALRGFGAMGGAYGQAETRLARGMVLATHPDGDPGAALEDLRAAADAFTALGARPALARTQRATGLAYARLGKVEEADAALGEAASLAASMKLLDGPWPASLTELEAARSAGTPLQPVD